MVKIKYIDIEIDKKTLTLTLDQVHILRDELNRAFPKTEQKPSYVKNRAKAFLYMEARHNPTKVNCNIL